MLQARLLCPMLNPHPCWYFFGCFPRCFDGYWWKRQWLMGQNIQNPSSIDAFPTFSYGDVARVQPMYAVAVCCYIILIELILFPWYWNRFQPIWRIFSIWGNRYPISMVEINPAYDPNSKALRTPRDHQETSGTIKTYEQTVRDHMHS